MRALAILLVATCSGTSSHETPKRVAFDTRTPAPLRATAAVVATRPLPSASARALAGTSAPLKSRAPRAWGPAIDGVIRRLPPSNEPRIALTLDACGGPGGNGYDAELIELLRIEKLKATLFLATRWIDAHPETARELAAEPLFQLENHGARHLPCSADGRAAFGIRGTATLEDARNEILRGRERIQALTGRVPRFFRPGTGYFDDVCVDLVRDLGGRPLGFSVGGDGGAGFSRQKVRRKIAGAPDGAIVLIHMNHPNSATKEGLSDALVDLRKRGVQLVTLAEALQPAG